MSRSILHPIGIVRFAALAIALFAPLALGDIPYTDPAPLNSNAATDSGHDFYPRIAGDREDTYVVVWRSLDSLGGTVGTDEDIFFTRSTNDGQTWSTVATLNDGATSDDFIDDKPDIATDGSTWIVVWQSDRSAGEDDGTDDDIFYSRSTDGGATWSTAAAIHSNATSDLADSDDDPRILTDGAGTWICAWSTAAQLVDDTQFDRDIAFVRSTDDGETWSAPGYLNSNSVNATGHDYNPSLAVSAEGTWIAVWETTDDLTDKGISDDNDLLVARSTNGGQAWSSAAFLNSDAATDQGGSIGGNEGSVSAVAVGDGSWLATWHRYLDEGGAQGLTVRSIDDGQTWTSPRVFENPSGSGKAADPSTIQLSSLAYSQRIYVPYTSDRSSEQPAGTDKALSGNDYDLRGKFSADGGETWTDGEFINTNAFGDSGDDETSVIAGDDDGNVVLVWTSFDSLGNTVGGDADIFFARASIGTITELLSPNGGEKWKRGDKKQIRWISSFPASAKVGIDLLRNGSKVETIDNSTKNDGKTKWKLPNNLSKGGGYQVRVTQKSDPTASDESYYYFRVK